jgi:sarcosine oxidase
VAAVAARQSEVGEQPRDALIEHGAIVAAGLVAERRGEPALADTADQQVGVVVDPTAFDQHRQQAAVEAARGAIVDVVAALARIWPTPSGIRVSTSTDEVTAKQVILAAGPWICGLVPGLARHLKITRQAVGWFKPTKPETVAYGEFPIFIIEGKRGMIYGFPDFEGRGVKAARHDHGPVVGADDWYPPATDEELEAVGVTLAELVPGAAGSIADRDICLYTNTLKADTIDDGGDEFIIDRLPTDLRLSVASQRSVSCQNVSVTLLRRGGRSGSNPQARAVCSIIR